MDKIENDVVNFSENTESKSKKNKKRKRVKKVVFLDEVLPSKTKKLEDLKEENLQETVSSHNDNSVEEQDIKKKSKKYIKLILDPIEENTFFENNWEQRPVHISRKDCGYYDFFITAEKLYEVISKKNSHQFRIINDKNVNLNNETMFVNDFLYYTENECFAVVNPEKHFNSMHCVVSQLQDYFSARIHTKVFISEKNYNIIAPRSDSTDTFIMQIEGTSQWTLYFPSKMLPMKSEVYSETDNLKTVMNVTLFPGDFLYFPNGLPYECETENDERSIFVVLSITKITWGDFLKVLLHMTLQQKFASDWQFRNNLPMGYLNYCGRAHVNNDSKNKEKFMQTLQSHVNELFSDMPIDSAVDQLAKYNIQQFIPPHLSNFNRKKSIFQKGNAILNNDESLAIPNFDSKIRLINPKSIRLVLEADEYRVYHSLHNNFVNIESQFVTINYTLAPGIEALVKNFPRFFPVRDLPIEEDSEKIQISKVLWQNGLIITKQNV